MQEAAREEAGTESGSGFFRWWNFDIVENVAKEWLHRRYSFVSILGANRRSRPLPGCRKVKFPWTSWRFWKQTARPCYNKSRIALYFFDSATLEQMNWGIGSKTTTTKKLTHLSKKQITRTCNRKWWWVTSPHIQTHTKTPTNMTLGVLFLSSACRVAVDGLE